MTGPAISVARWAGEHRRAALALSAALVGVLTGAGLAVVLPNKGGSPDCGIPTELTVLTSTDVHGAIKRTLRDYERYAARSSRCPVVHLTAYPAANSRLPGGASGMRSVESQFAAWVPEGLSDIGARPDVWISDSPYDVNLARRSLSAAAAQPTFEERGPVANSSLVIGLPTAVAEGPLRDLLAENKGLVRESGWKAVYRLLHGNGIALSLPDPSTSDTGLFHLTGLSQALGPQEGLRAATARRDYQPDALPLLCSALQTAKQKNAPLPATTAYLVSEAALVNHNKGGCGSGTLKPDRSQELQPLYLLGTRPLRYTFTSVHWGGPQDATRSGYAQDYYSWLIDRNKGGRVLADAGQLRLPSTPSFCDTNNAMASYRAAREDPSCQARQDGSGPDEEARQALTAFETTRPSAQILIGIDSSKTMALNLTPIRDSIASALVPPDTTAGPVGRLDRLALWRLPGPKKETKVSLLPFGPGGWKNRGEITSRLRNIRPAPHAAVYDMLIDAEAELRRLPNSASGNAAAPVQAVLLLSDGDGYAGRAKEPHGGTPDQVTAAFTPGDGSRSVQLHIIAFGSIGCQGPLGELADRNHGTCQTATKPELERQLTQVLSRLAKG